MPWIYHQRTGKLLGPNGALVVIGYSGREDGYNNPAMQEVAEIGPIPAGTYAIGAPFMHAHAGPVTMRLMPVAGTNTFGRDGFMIHGDTAEHADHPTPHNSASHGCIIVSRPSRQAVAGSDDRTLVVTA